MGVSGYADNFSLLFFVIEIKEFFLETVKIMQ